MLSESVIVDNGFVRNTPVKEIGKCVKSFHTERFKPYPLNYTKNYSKNHKNLLFDDDAFDSILGKSKRKIRQVKSVKITKVLHGFYQTPVKEKLIHLGNLELVSPLDPLTTPVNSLIGSVKKQTFSGQLKKFKPKESPLKHDISESLLSELSRANSGKGVSRDKSSITRKSLKKPEGKIINITLEDTSRDLVEPNSLLETEIFNNKSPRIQDLSNVHKLNENDIDDDFLDQFDKEIDATDIDSVKDDLCITEQKMNMADHLVEKVVSITELLQDNTLKIESVKMERENTSDSIEKNIEKEASIISENIKHESTKCAQIESVKTENCALETVFANQEEHHVLISQEVEKCLQNVSECSSWWDIYGEESNSPEFKSQTVVYDSEVDVF